MWQLGMTWWQSYVCWWDKLTYDGEIHDYALRLSTGHFYVGLCVRESAAMGSDYKEIH